MRHPRLVCSRVGVAVDARKLRVVGRNLVAIGTHRTVVRDREPGVVERRARPGGGRVASVAGGWIPGGEVVRDGAAQSCRAVPIRCVAWIAGRVRCGQGVTAVGRGVAQGAGGRQVITG